jgi:hypothetical protein
MSLTSYLKVPDVREKFKEQFIKPKVSLKKDILATPRTERYGMVGTAFDYLLRFYIKRNNPNAIERPWIAEQTIRPNFMQRLSVAAEMGGMATYDMTTGEHFIFNEKTGEKTAFPETIEMKKAKEIVTQAKEIYQDYLISGNMTDKVIETTILLAQLDPIFRAGLVENLGRIDSEDVADLRALISLVEPQTFHAEELCLLNPTFGEASHMVGGADADLIIDDMIVDIKTSKAIQFTLDQFLQLAGYYVLFRISGVDNAPYQPKIERLGIYYSRYAELFIIPVADVVNEEKLEPFIHWFKERVKKH